MLHAIYEIKRQKLSMKTDPSLVWNLGLGKQFPKLKDIALRLMQMGTQSADVDRVCKAHKLLHTKARNRLANRNVNSLMYCYVNLRLLKKYERQKGMTV